MIRMEPLGDQKGEVLNRQSPVLTAAEGDRQPGRLQVGAVENRVIGSAARFHVFIRPIRGHFSILLLEEVSVSFIISSADDVPFFHLFRVNKS